MEITIWPPQPGNAAQVFLLHKETVRMRTSPQHLVISLIGLFLLVAGLAATMDTNAHIGLGPVAGEPVAIPAEIVTEAVKNGGVKVFLLGSYEEKHAFAKGLPTQYGQMSFNADDFLKYRAGWSERKIHAVGHSLGFSELWNN